MVSFMHTYTTSQHVLKDAMHYELHIHNLNLEVCATFKHVTLSPGLNIIHGLIRWPTGLLTISQPSTGSGSIPRELRRSTRKT
jgi:hypothetical protein